MIEFSRKEIKNEPRLKPLYDLLKKRHRVANHTKKILLRNKDIKDFCEESRHFAMLPLDDPIYMHYDVANWYQKPDKVAIRIEAIAVYDNFAEYESARVKQLHNASDADIPGLN